MPASRNNPTLGPHVNMIDPITYENVSPNSAWYIRSNVRNGKIYHVYRRPTLERLAAMQPRSSPITRLPFSQANIRKLSDHSGVAPVSVSASTSHPRIRRNMQLADMVARRQPLAQLKSLAMTLEPMEYVRIKTTGLFNNVIILRGYRESFFIFYGGDWFHCISDTLINSLRTVFLYNPSGYYLGYRRQIYAG